MVGYQLNWLEQADAYCERVDFAFWGEPLNAVTNLSFVLVGLFMWRRTRGLSMGQALSAITIIIGVGSFLWHSYAARWAGVADTAPIGVFILVYIFATNRGILGLPVWLSLVGTAAFLPYAAILLPILNSVPFLAISNIYWTVPILLTIYALWPLRNQDEATGFLVGAAILVLSISIRSMDETLCAAIPIGTHFLWHAINGLMLGWMIEVYRRSQVKKR